MIVMALMPVKVLRREVQREEKRVVGEKNEKDRFRERCEGKRVVGRYLNLRSDPNKFQSFLHLTLYVGNF